MFRVPAGVFEASVAALLAAAVMRAQLLPLHSSNCFHP